MKMIFAGILLVSLLAAGCIDLGGLLGNGQAAPSAQPTIRTGAATARPTAVVTQTATAGATAVPSASAAAQINAPTVTPTPTPIAPTTQALPTSVIEVKVKKFAFTPSTLSIKKGTSVILRVTGEDDGTGNGHSFKMLDFGINIPVRQGQTNQASFVADKAGEFTYKDSLCCGTTNPAILGKLTVTP
ncbi:cupredoxin domain-containing protein [Candidatus Micrarchaeota archaeon]|nr:cupredoxin domain-containing protein [Candidatus Micrarchaeota archaeon]